MSTSSFDFGVATFGRRRTAETGFAIFAKAGLLSTFPNMNLCEVFQLPRGLRLVAGATTFGIARAKEPSLKLEYVALTAYELGEVDRDKRDTYWGAAICYVNRGVHPEGGSILPMLSRLLEISRIQQG